MRPPRILLFCVLAFACFGLALLFWKLGDPATPTPTASSSHTTRPDRDPGGVDLGALPTDSRPSTSSGGVTAPPVLLPSDFATVPSPAARRDDDGFELVEWTEGEPHFEGEFIAAYVTLGASGRKLRMTVNQMGEFPRVQVATRERVQVELEFSRTQPGDHIAVAAQDGGFVDGSHSAALTVNDQRRVRFAFDVSANDGVHYVSVMTQNGVSRLLDFWAGPMPTLRSTASTR